jgi:hypothetical protein
MVSLRIHVLKDKTLVDRFPPNAVFTVCHVSLPLRDEYTPHDLPLLFYFGHFSLIQGTRAGLKSGLWKLSGIEFF